MQKVKKSTLAFIIPHDLFLYESYRTRFQPNVCKAGKIAQGISGMELVIKVEEHGMRVGDNGLSINFPQGFTLQIFGLLPN